MEKTMKARVQHKHDVEANWLKATNFTPLASEIIVYDPDENYDYPRIKIGDGETNINTLPFVTKDYAKISDIPTKPEDIGALPDSTVIPTVPTKISAFENDKGYLTQHQSLDAYAKTDDLGALATKDSLTASDVGALPDTTKIPSTLSDLTTDSTHRTVTDTEKNTWNAKANVSDIPTKVSDLTNDKGYITSYTETDPTVPSWAKAATKPSYTASEVGALPSTTKIPGALSDLNEDTTHRVVTDEEKEAWNAKSNFSGNYADLNGKPTIPTVPTKVSAFTNDAGYLTEHQDISHKLDASALPTAINTALEQAKESGEFDGTSVTVMGVINSNEDGGSNVVTFSDGKTVTIKNGSKGSTGSRGDTGATGQRGTGLLSVTTAPSSYTTEVGGITPKYRMALSTIKTQAGVTEVLLGDTIRYSYYHYPIAHLDASYAYFTTRVSIRGATGVDGTNGADGMPGAPGAKGEDGYTPVKGVDYYTDSDKAEWSTYIASELAKRGQLKPEFANSISECTDTTKLYVLPDGFIYAYILTEVETGPSYKNWLTYSVNKDGTDYVGDNGEDGYRKGYRYSASSAVEKSATGYDCIGWLPVKPNDVIRITNVSEMSASTDASNYCTAIFLNSTFAQQNKTFYLTNSNNQITVENGLYTLVVPNESTICWVKLTLMGVTADTIITINEEITEGGGTTTGYAWVSTGRAFVPADYEDRIISLEEQTAELRELIKNSGGSTEPEVGFTNMIPLSTNADGSPYVGDNGEAGYRAGYRVSSSGTEKEAAGYSCTGFIPVVAGDVIRIKNVPQHTSSNDGSGYAVAYYFSSSFERVWGGIFINNIDRNVDYSNGIHSFTIPDYSDIAYIRVSLLGVTGDTILTVNQEITENSGSSGSGSTGDSSNDGGNPEETLEESLDRIKNWKYPIHEDAPVFLLETDKPAISSNEQTTEAIYAKYDALMNANPGLVTKVDCGMASDGATPIYVYHFKEAEPHYSTPLWSETKPVILICSGVHPTEQSGVHSLYHAMEEITTNPKLRDLRRNVHFIVMPMINPTAFNDSTYGVRNPDGIQVHYNFEVDFKYPMDSGYVANGNRNHGGEVPLSIPETQYFDALMEEYKENLALVISCHNNDVDEQYGTGFIWCSCATHFMCNLGFRFVDKMSDAWRKKHGTAFDEGIRWANEYALAQAEAGSSLFNSAYTKEQPEWDYRVGRASISGSGGTEYKQALKYGVHGINVEVCDRCMILDKDFGKKRTANVVTMGTETYINFFRTFMAIYDPKNKKDYAPNLPRK